jgi:pathogenesis-related protein 1
MIMMFKISLAIVCLAMVRVSLAQNSPQDYLNAHSSARAQVGVGPMRWDAKVASYAQNYVNKLKGSCKLVHSGNDYCLSKKL